MIQTSNEFYINMKDKPEYDVTKDYFEQSIEVIDFYKEEFRKCIEGVTIGGVFIHPWLYFHLNFFKADLPAGKGIDKLMNPPLDDHIWYFVETYMEAEQKDKGLLMFGTRGFSKSTLIASHICWVNTIKDTGVSTVMGGSSEDLTTISNMIQTGFNKIHPSMLLPRTKSGWETHVEFGTKDTNHVKDLHSQIVITNVNGGTSSDSEKSAGQTPIAYIFDEIGKVEFLKSYKASLPAFKNQFGFRCVPILCGTGGNNTLSRDAKKVLTNPALHDMLPMNWDRLDSKVDPEYITWDSKKKFGMFVPGQMSYRLDKIKKINKPLDEYLGIKKHKELEGITINVTDWKGTTEFLKQELVRLKKDEDSYNKQRMYHPLTTDDCFITDSINPFPVKKAREHLQFIEDEGLTGKNVEITPDGKHYSYSFSEKNRVKYPHSGGEANCPIVLYNEELPETKPQDYKYVTGLDHYKTDLADTDSVGAAYVLKRRGIGIGDDVAPCETIVCSYAARPERMKDFNVNLEHIVKSWNAQCCMESIDTSFKQHLDINNEAELYLTESISFASLNSKKKRKKLNNKFGIFPNAANKMYLMNMVIDYCKERHVIDIDDEGNQIVKLGIEFINDPELLREIINYHSEANVDRIVAFGHALIWCRYLETNRIFPNQKNKEDYDEDDYTRKSRKRRPTFFSTRRKKFF